MKLKRRLHTLIVRNWREKLVAVALAFLFWYLVRSQAVVRRSHFYDIPNMPMRGQL